MKEKKNLTVCWQCLTANSTGLWIWPHDLMCGWGLNRSCPFFFCSLFYVLFSIKKSATFDWVNFNMLITQSGLQNSIISLLKIKPRLIDVDIYIFSSPSASQFFTFVDNKSS